MIRICKQSYYFLPNKRQKTPNKSVFLKIIQLFLRKMPVYSFFNS